MAVSSYDDRDVLKVAAKSVSYNILLQVLMRIVSFVSNSIIIRFMNSDVLGVVNVRLMLLYSTTQCFSREAFRRSSLCKIDERNYVKVINLLWLPIPVCFFTGLLLQFVWLYFLEQPDPTRVAHYDVGVNFVFASVLIEIFSEPLYVLGQNFHFVKLKVIIEGLSLTCKSVCMVILLIKWPNSGIYAFCFSQVLSSVVYTASYYIYFFWYFHLKHTLDSNPVIPFKSLTQVFPKLSFGEEFLDHRMLLLTWSFYKQTFIKQFLTEGERYIMTLLNVLSFSEQGIYDIVSNLGSLAARLVFQPIEESGYVLFSNLVKRGQPASEQKNSALNLTVLQHLMKLMSLLGLTILVFGFSYSRLLLLWYGGDTLSNSLALSLLRWHCVYILFLALNGVSECFVFSTMSSAEINGYNKKMIMFSVIFLAMAFYFTSVYGSVGFLLANCLNSSLRIAHSFYFIKCHFDRTILSFIKSFVPHSFVLSTFVVIFILTSVSEVWFCCSQGFKLVSVHLFVGICCVCALFVAVLLADSELVQFVMRQLRGKEKPKDT